MFSLIFFASLLEIFFNTNHSSTSIYDIWESSMNYFNTRAAEDKKISSISEEICNSIDFISKSNTKIKFLHKSAETLSLKTLGTACPPLQVSALTLASLQNLESSKITFLSQQLGKLVAYDPPLRGGPVGPCLLPNVLDFTKQSSFILRYTNENISGVEIRIENNLPLWFYKNSSVVAL